MIEPLWCVHVIGPDEVHATASLRDAVRAAHGFNTWWHPRTKDDSDADYVLMYANVAQWPHDAESHASSLADPSNDMADYAARLAKALGPESTDGR